MVVSGVGAVGSTETDHIFFSPGAVTSVVEGKEQFKTQATRSVEGQLQRGKDGTDIVGDVKSKCINMSFLCEGNICLPVGLSIVVCIADLSQELVSTISCHQKLNARVP